LNRSMIDAGYFDKAKQHLATFHMQRILRIHPTPDGLFNDTSMLVNAGGIDPGIDCQSLGEVQIRIVRNFDHSIWIKAKRLSDFTGRERRPILKCAVVATLDVIRISVSRPPTDQI